MSCAAIWGIRQLAELKFIRECLIYDSHIEVEINSFSYEHLLYFEAKRKTGSTQYGELYAMGVTHIVVPLLQITVAYQV